MTPRLSIVHVIHSLGPGGAEHTLVDLAREAPEHGMDLNVVSLMPLGSNPYPRRLAELGAGVHSLGLSSRWDPRGLARGARLIGSLQPDVIHTHLKHADLVGAWAARRLGVPMASTLHLIENAPTALGRAKRSLAAQARLRMADRTIAVSNALRDWYVDAFPVDPNRVVCLPNGVAKPVPTSAASRDAIRRDLGIRPDALMATMVGIMRPDKGHEQLLDAVHAMSSASSIQFAMLGDGPLRDDLEHQAHRLQLGPDRIVFAGFREDVVEVLGASDLVVHPTLDDALPTALLHGLAAGLPILASNTGGIPEIVTRETGILVPPGDVAALVDGLERLVAQLPAPEMAVAARARFDDEFDAKIWAARLRHLYEEIITESQN
jgi:glycosyltransferase involved in cell wall biosynthesis